jgi:hypothetical protein
MLSHRLVPLAVLVGVTIWTTGVARAACDARLEVSGLRRTSESLVRDLMPRPTPGCFSEEDVAEFERRLWDTSIFDDVKVSEENSVLKVAIREKWTLIPGIDFSSGQTIRDSSLNVSLVEGNMFGRASALFGSIGWIQRGINAELLWSENEYLAQRYSFEAALLLVSSEVVFTDAKPWARTRIGASFGLRPKYGYSAPVRLVWTLRGYRETSSREDELLPGSVQARGFYASAGARLTWDEYEWQDLTPHGYKISIELYPGLFAGANRLRARHEFNSDFVIATALGERTALLGRVAVDAASPGDPNHAVILGTADGVRGLPDNLFRNALHVYGNLELRHALEITPRIFVQGALFADVATYAQMNIAGEVQGLNAAVSAGGGVRLVPTFLSGVVPRVDAGAVLYQRKPEPFVRFGLAQYF